MKKIYSELARIQQELKAPKNLYNSFGKYSYRNAEGILEAVKPLLNGLCLLLSDKIIQVGDRYYVEATAILTDGDESVSVTASAREDETKKGMDGCQITGSCSSYARKYALNGLFDIDDNKDSDDDSLSPKNPKNSGKEAPEYKPAGKPFAPPSAAGTAAVSTAEAAPGLPVTDYIHAEVEEIQKKLGLDDYNLARKQVSAWIAALVKSGAIEPIDWSTITIDQAVNAFQAISETFLQKGGEK